jgi:hypothetical protein
MCAKVFSVCPVCDDGIEEGESVVLEDGVPQHSSHTGLDN